MHEREGKKNARERRTCPTILSTLERFEKARLPTVEDTLQVLSSSEVDINGLKCRFFKLHSRYYNNHS